MYQRALVGKEKVLGPNHPLTLGTVNSLGLLYKDQGRLLRLRTNDIMHGYKKALQLLEPAIQAINILVPTAQLLPPPPACLDLLYTPSSLSTIITNPTSRLISFGVKL